VIRRNIDAMVMQIRREINEACSKVANEVASRRSTAKGVYTVSRFFECARRPLIIRLTAIPKNNNIG
jgi:hypothetical protein